MGTRSHLAGLCLLLAGLVTVSRADTAGVEHPVAGKLSLWGGAKPRVSFVARFSGPVGTVFNPAAAGSTVHFVGGPGEGDSGFIVLATDHWRGMGRGKGFKYVDRSGSAGGIRLIVLRMGKHGGSLRIAGGRPNWRYTLDGPQTSVAVSLTIGTARWCAEFRGFSKNSAKRVVGETKTPPATCPCDAGFTSTWQAIQASIFDRHGCTNDLCHGSAAQSGLDLRPDVAYRNLVDAPSTAVPGQKRVEPGEQSRSLLWRKLAKATIGDGYADVPGAGMPNNLPPISTDELEAVRLWIRAGAPSDGVVARTDSLLALCLPPPDPIKIRPAEPPAPGEGVQLHAPPWQIPAHGENEVCFVSYYDFSATIPAEQQAPCPGFWGGPTKSCFFYKKSELTQDPNSHHSIIHVYKGAYDIEDPAADFGPFTCHGGANDGHACDPKGDASQCGAGSGCAGRVVSRVACIGYGPPDYGFDISGTGSDNSPAVGGSQQPLYVNAFASGVFAAFPVKGTMVWNSHAFNLTDQPTTNEQWFNLYFAGAAERIYPVRGIFDSRDIFTQNVPAFQTREYCRTITMPKGTRIFELSSHTHKRGKLFRVFGPGIATACSSQAGDVCLPETTPPILTTTQYNDPAQVHFDPPLTLDGDDPASRRLKFCSLYDNGATDPLEVKRRSTSPIPPPPIPSGTFGGPCSNAEAVCLVGPHKGEPCAGIDGRCDSSAGANDGLCDACPLKGGVTTEDEMFILLGTYYCVPGSECETTGPQ